MADADAGIYFTAKKCSTIHGKMIMNIALCGRNHSSLQMQDTTLLTKTECLTCTCIQMKQNVGVIISLSGSDPARNMHCIDTDHTVILIILIDTVLTLRNIDPARNMY